MRIRRSWEEVRRTVDERLRSLAPVAGGYRFRRCVPDQTE
jgi:hypothetical protein